MIEGARGGGPIDTVVDSHPVNVDTVILMVEARILSVEGRKNESFDFRLSTIDYR